jgi:hypothetical protein
VKRDPKPDVAVDYPLVLVVWEDAGSRDSGTWADKPKDQNYEPFYFKQVGFLMYDGPEGIVLSDAIGNNDQIAPRTQIPRGMVRSITKLAA